MCKLIDVLDPNTPWDKGEPYNEDEAPVVPRNERWVGGRVPSYSLEKAKRLQRKERKGQYFVPAVNRNIGRQLDKSVREGCLCSCSSLCTLLGV